MPIPIASTGFFSRYALRKTRSAIPYGAVIADLGTPTTGQPYKFGGKELITANGLNEYDFGARQYYSAVPAFTRIDPMAEKYPWLSPLPLLRQQSGEQHRPYWYVCGKGKSGGVETK